MEKASMENHFGFCAIKSPQTRMNTNKNGPVIYYDRPRCLSHMKKMFSVFRQWELNFRTRKILVATTSRCKSVYNRTGEPSTTLCERGGARKWADSLFYVANKKQIGAKRTLLRRICQLQNRYLLQQREKIFIKNWVRNANCVQTQSVSGD